MTRFSATSRIWVCIFPLVARPLGPHSPPTSLLSPKTVRIQALATFINPRPTGTGKPDRPPAFIFGHGLWNDLDLQAHINWIDEILAATTEQLPYLNDPAALWPRLVVTPNAAGRNKPDEWLVSQGNKALSIYEDSVRIEDGRRGIEHLGTFNMSVQANMYDGGHCDLRGNLIKAMMVMNWLNMVEVEKH